MSREIKFRAWNERGKCWIIFGCSRYCFNDGVLDILDDSDLIYEQYTGLKDKNGKEIYEGDIIKDTSDGDCLINAVFWCEKGGYWGVKPRSPFADRDWGWFIGRDSIEVIGNIHENPELLEDK